MNKAFEFAVRVTYIKMSKPIYKGFKMYQYFFSLCNTDMLFIIQTILIVLVFLSFNLRYIYTCIPNILFVRVLFLPCV